MAMTKCRECGNQVSTTAAACPSCGAKPPSRSGKLGLIIIGSVLAIVGLQAARDRVHTTPTPVSAPTSAVAQSPPASSTQAKDLDVQLAIQSDGNNPPSIVGTSNLPTGFELIVVVSREAIGYVAQDRSTVTSGVFRAGPLSMDGAPLRPGKYTVRVTSPMPKLMSPTARTYAGENGEHLRGALTHEASTMPGVRMVDYEGEFVVAGIVSEEGDRAYLQQHNSAWTYTESDTEMGDGAIRGAMVTSSNTLSLAFPYAGDQHATLQLRSHPRFGRDVIVSVQRGQFQCGLYECTVRVKFDDEKATTYTASPPSDSDSKYIFLRNFDRFVSQMKKAQSVKIEAPFFQNGNQVMEFAVQGFDQAKLGSSRAKK